MAPERGGRTHASWITALTPQELGQCSSGTPKNTPTPVPRGFHWVHFCFQFFGRYGVPGTWDGNSSCAWKALICVVRCLTEGPQGVPWNRHVRCVCLLSHHLLTSFLLCQFRTTANRDSEKPSSVSLWISAILVVLPLSPQLVVSRATMNSYLLDSNQMIRLNSVLASFINHTEKYTSTPHPVQAAAS